MPLTFYVAYEQELDSQQERIIELQNTNKNLKKKLEESKKHVRDNSPNKETENFEKVNAQLEQKNEDLKEEIEQLKQKLRQVSFLFSSPFLSFHISILFSNLSKFYLDQQRT